MSSTYFVLVTLAVYASIGHSLDLARFDAMNGMEEMPQDLGEYNFWTCTGEGSDRSCEFNDEEGMAYMQGVGIYGIANFVGMIVVLLIILLNISCHIISCCCGIYRRCCKKKVIVVPEVGPNGEMVEPPKQVDDYLGKYTRRDHCRIISFVFVIVGIPLWCILGMTLGASQLAENSPGLVNAPSGVKDFIMFTEPVITNQLISQVGSSLVPLVQGIDDLIQTAVSFDEVIGAAETLNASLKDFPQVQTFIDMAYEAANLTTTGSAPIIDGVITEMTGLNDTINNMTALANDLEEFVKDVGAQNGQLSNELNSTSIVIADLRVLVVELVGDGGSNVGAVTTISDDLNALPAATNFDTAGSSVSSMGSSGLDGNPSGITSVVSDCTTVYTTLASLPNYTETAALLTTINTNMAAMSGDGGSFDQLTWRINNITHVVDNYPSFSRIGDLLGDVDTTVQSVDINPLTALLRDLLDLFNVVPEWIADVDAEIDKVRGLIYVGINVTQSLTKQIYSFNQTIMGVPDEIMDIANYTFGSKFNHSYLLEQLNNITDVVSDMNETVTDLLEEGNEAVDLAAEFGGNLTDILNDFNINDMIQQVDDAAAKMASINFTQPVEMIAALRSDISSFSLEASFITALENVQTYFETLRPLLQRVVNTTAGGSNSASEGDFLVLAKGHCSGDGSINNCEDNTVCAGAGTCTGFGDYRCADNGLTACTADSDCSGSYCLADSSRITTLSSTLNLYGSSASVPTGDVTSMLSSLSNFDSTVSQLDEASSSITSAREGIDSFDVNETVDMLQDLQDSMNDLGLSDLIDQVVDAKDMLNDLNVSDMIEPYEDYGDHQDRFNRDMSDAVYDLIAIKNFFVDPSLALGTVYNNLAVSNLEAVYAAEGPSGLARYVISQVDSLNNYFADNVLVLFNVSREDRRDEYDDRFEILDKMGGYPQAGYGDMRENGALYYLMRFFNSPTVRSSYPKIMGVFVNSDYEKYEDGKTCVTEGCEEHTMDVIHNDPMSEWSKEIPGLEIGINYSLADVFMMMWIPPLLTVFFGICTALLNFKFYKERLRKGCTCLFMSCVICQIPFVLIFTAMLFPMTILLSDLCTTGANVGSSYLIAYGDPVCTEIINGEGTLTACNVVVDTVGDENITITIDALGMYNSVVSGECSGKDPFASIMDTFADEIIDQPSDALEDWFEDNEDLELREPVKSLMRETAVNQGNTMANFFRLLGEHLINCERFAGIANGLYGATCGSFIHPFLWLAGSWYLVGWTLVCCAFPAGCLKKKYNLVNEDELGRSGEVAPVGAPAAAGDVNEIEMVHAHPIADVDEPINKSHSVSPRPVHSSQSTPRKSPRPRAGSGDRIEVAHHSNEHVPQAELAAAADDDAMV